MSTDPFDLDTGTKRVIIIINLVLVVVVVVAVAAVVVAQVVENLKYQI